MWRSGWMRVAFLVYEYTAAPPEEQNDRGPHSSFESTKKLQRGPVGDCSQLLRSWNKYGGRPHSVGYFSVTELIVVRIVDEIRRGC